MTKLQEGTKYDGSKARMDLISPHFPYATAEVLKYGADKYADRNWEKGISYGRVFSALMRHLWDWWRGETHDKESGIPHLHHAACNLMFLIHFENDFKKYHEFDDRPHSDVDEYYGES